MNDSMAVAEADPNDCLAGPGQSPYLRYQANYKVPQHRADVLGLEGGTPPVPAG